MNNTKVENASRSERPERRTRYAEPASGAAAPRRAGSRKAAVKLAVAAASALSIQLFAQTVVVDPPLPLSAMSLKTVSVPGPSAQVLAEFVTNKAAAIQLGKALFWDSRVGSDNKTACATCHASAGADARVKNQVSPGLLRRNADLSFNADNTFQVGGDPNPNHTFIATDFPFTTFVLPANNDPNQRLTDVNDVASSQGVFNGSFTALNVTNRGVGPDTCTFTMDSDNGFHIGSTNTRRVEPRNTPTVVNAVFNFRNFWDGRGNNIFNGGDPFGNRNPNAQVWKFENGVLRKIHVSIPSSSLASQASGPPLSAFEMSCANRTFAQLGQKMLGQNILADQKISSSDSVLGRFANGRPLYRALVSQAFNPAYWAAPSTVHFTTQDARQVASMDIRRPVPFNAPLDINVSQMEANFALFFGLAIQLYESTLVADNTPFDQYAAGDSSKLSDEQKAGFEIFKDKGKCIACHGGPELTNASFNNVVNKRLEKMVMGNGSTKTYDNGFYNVGTRPTLDDVGVGGTDPFGNPLSESLFMTLATDKQAAANILGNDFDLSKYDIPTSADQVNVLGAFKTPGLRNVEITGPYFHNGGKATLMQVVDHYNRGGDFGRDNLPNLDPDIEPLGLTDTEKHSLVSFLLSLTDDRVRMEKAPFDHPSLCVPNGHPASSFTASPPLVNAADDMLCLNEVGANGRGTPLPTFLNLSPFAD